MQVCRDWPESASTPRILNRREVYCGNRQQSAFYNPKTARSRRQVFDGTADVVMVRSRRSSC